MRERKIGGLPVLERDALVGIITESDIFRALVKNWQHTETGDYLEYEFNR